MYRKTHFLMLIVINSSINIIICVNSMFAAIPYAKPYVKRVATKISMRNKVLKTRPQADHAKLTRRKAAMTRNDPETVATLR